MDPSIDQPAPSPGEEFKRGFAGDDLQPEVLRRRREFAGTSMHLSNAIKDVYAQYDAERGQSPRRAASHFLHRLARR